MNFLETKTINKFKDLLENLKQEIIKDLTKILDDFEPNHVFSSWNLNRYKLKTLKDIKDVFEKFDFDETGDIIDTIKSFFKNDFEIDNSDLELENHLKDFRVQTSTKLETFTKTFKAINDDDFEIDNSDLELGFQTSTKLETDEEENLLDEEEGNAATPPPIVLPDSDDDQEYLTAVLAIELETDSFEDFKNEARIDFKLDLPNTKTVNFNGWSWHLRLKQDIFGPDDSEYRIDVQASDDEHTTDCLHDIWGVMSMGSDLVNWDYDNMTLTEMRPVWDYCNRVSGKKFVWKILRSLNTLPTETLQRFVTEADRELNIRISKHPITVLKEWAEKNLNRDVKYNFTHSQNPPGWTCAVLIFEGSATEMFSWFVQHQGNNEKIKKEAKKIVSQSAIDNSKLLNTASTKKEDTSENEPTADVEILK
uniref:Uncharacterized protein n=1 Tax=Marseillevirus LCMAC102 TaxID=2506603 RepID=A0A481YU31_9VIRU|nr:MAG: uncharacterized protein LCMAC102_01860 [Marseillevirus LCMAC102]